MGVPCVTVVGTCPGLDTWHGGAGVCRGGVPSVVLTPSRGAVGVAEWDAHREELIPSLSWCQVDPFSRCRDKPLLPASARRGRESCVPRRVCGGARVAVAPRPLCVHPRVGAAKVTRPESARAVSARALAAPSLIGSSTGPRTRTRRAHGRHRRSRRCGFATRAAVRGRLCGGRRAHPGWR